MARLAERRAVRANLGTAYAALHGTGVLRGAHWRAPMMRSDGAYTAEDAKRDVQSLREDGRRAKALLNGARDGDSGPRAARGCLPWARLWAFVWRRKGADAGESRTAAVRGLLHRFTASGKHEMAVTKLAKAELDLKSRVEQLESRVKLAKEEAVLRMRANQKVPALRAMKRSKMLEQSLQQANAQQLALERQQEMLEEARFSKTVTGALTSTMSNLKSTCTSAQLASAQSAVDDVADISADMEDFNETVREFGEARMQHAGVDDDDSLLAELEEMVGEAQDTPPVASCTGDEAAEAGGRVVAEGSNLESVRAMPPVPKRPTFAASKKQAQYAMLADDDL